MNDSEPIQVVLVDDHAVVRKGIREFLEDEGDIRVVAEAADGEKALVLINEHKPDVVVVDIQMPGINGIELTRRLRAATNPVGILVLTAHDDDPYIMAGIEAGANGYVLKSASPEEIVRAVRAVREGQSAVDPAVASKLIRYLSARSSTAASKAAETLTDRELEVMALVAEGLTNRAIGRKLGISDRTVQGHLANVFSKLGASSRTEAVMVAVKLGWIEV